MRCFDCAYYDENGDATGYCSSTGDMVDADDDGCMVGLRKPRDDEEDGR